MAMTPKERVTAALKCEPVDRMPSSPLNGNAWVNKEAGLSWRDLYDMEDAGAAIYVDYYNRIHSDIVFPGCGPWMAFACILGAEVDMRGVGENMEVKGVLTADDLLTDPRLDMTYDEIKEALLATDHMQFSLKQIREVAKLVGEEKHITGGPCGAFTMAAVACGIPNFMKMVGKKRPGLPRLLDFTGRMCAVISDLQVEAGLTMLFPADPMASGDMISPKMYKNYVVPATKSYMDNLKSDVPVVTHCCGHSGAYVEELMDLGMAGFSVDSMVDIEDCLKRADHKMCMFGNISPTDPLCIGTADQVYKESRRVLDLAYANGGAFVLGSGCDLAPGTPIENLQAMAKAADDAAQAHR